MTQHTIIAELSDGSKHDIVAAINIDKTQLIAIDQLRAFIERVENLEEQKAVIAADIKLVFDEAKSVGFSTKAIKEIIKIRKDSLDVYRQNRELLDLYATRLGIEL